MKYMGSKARIAKHIIPFLLEDWKEGMIFIDACCGGCNLINLIPNHIPKYGNDNNKYLIALFKGIQQGKLGETTIDKEYYSTVRESYNNNDNTFDDFTKGWVGFMGSANGRFFEGGYSGISQTKIGTSRNYIDESIRGLMKDLEQLKTVTFSNKEIWDIKPKLPSIIYCDIPYRDTKQYSTSKDFDYEKFYDWCREMKVKGHKIFISEYWMPSDFKCIWEQELKSSLSANGVIGGSKTSLEKLFTLC